MFKQWVNHWISRVGFVAYLIGNLVLFFFRETWTGRILVVVVLPLILLLLGWFSFIASPDPNALAEVTVRIRPGATLNQIADSLVDKNVIRSKRFVTIWGRIRGQDKRIKAGELKIPAGLNALEVVDALDDARTATVRVTLLEGSRADEMARILHQRLNIDSVKFLALVRDSSFAKQLTGVNSLEGYLLPETYQMEKNQPEEKIIKFLVRNTLRIFDIDSVRSKIDSMGFTVHQILTLASIVEGEALLDRERADIASLYHNRLKRNMRLQADPTIQYAVPGPPRRLLYKDLEIDSPYNTYKYSGLPPGPICNPGKRSILAAVFPNSTPYIYMVATGDGGHKFTTNLRDHNYWHKKFNEVRRRVRRQSR